MKICWHLNVKISRLQYMGTWMHENLRDVKAWKHDNITIMINIKFENMIVMIAIPRFELATLATYIHSRSLSRLNCSIVTFNIFYSFRFCNNWISWAAIIRSPRNKNYYFSNEDSFSRFFPDFFPDFFPGWRRSFFSTKSSIRSFLDLWITQKNIMEEKEGAY